MRSTRLARDRRSGLVICWPRLGPRVAIVLMYLCLSGVLVSCVLTPRLTPEDLRVLSSSFTCGAPPREIHISPEAARQMTDRITETMRDSGPFRLLISEVELTSYAALNLRGTEIRKIAIWFTQGRICLSAQFDLWGPRTIKAMLIATCRDDSIQIDVQKATLDGRLLPRFILASIQDAANDALADAHLSVRVKQIVLGEGFALIAGTRE